VEILERRLTLIHGDENSAQGNFDLIVCSGVLVDHMLPRRIRIANRLRDLIFPNGQLFITVFGTLDPACGKGTEVEPNTFIHDFGFPVHYFVPDELLTLFEGVLVSTCYTRIKNDFYPVPHVHETHVLIGRQNTVNAAWDLSGEKSVLIGRRATPPSERNGRRPTS
jgi:hypothetical protein